MAYSDFGLQLIVYDSCEFYGNHYNFYKPKHNILLTGSTTYHPNIWGW